ncbi:MAG: tagatose 1,6-diphosphate aldolase [Acidimicrobiia bacterium]
MELSAGKLWGLRRLSDEQGRFKMVAVDQRPPIKDLVMQARGTSVADFEDVALVKRLLVEELSSGASAVLLDPHFAYPKAIDAVSPRQGLLLTLENSVFTETPQGRMSSKIDDWSVEKIKRAGADAVKVLAWYRPDASPEVNEHQQQYVAAIGAECKKFDIPFLFELLVYPFPGDQDHTTSYVEAPMKRVDHVLESVATFAAPQFGVDVFKLESPLPANEVSDPDGDNDEEIESTQLLFDEVNRLSTVPWVMLSAGASQEAFRRIMKYAYRAGASGFLAGRAIWWDALANFPDIEETKRALRSDSLPYLASLNALTDAQAMPWTEHRAYGTEPPQLVPSDASFRHHYGGFTS